MAPRELPVVLIEISNAIDGIEQAASGKTQASLDQEWLLRHGIERGLEIIFEGVRHLPEHMLAEAPEIPWKQIRAIGNVLRHEYHRTSSRILWAVVVDELPRLRVAIDRLKGWPEANPPDA